MGIYYSKDNLANDVLTVAFWHYTTIQQGEFIYEGPIRVVLREGESFTIEEGGTTDEGHDYTQHCYTFNGDTVMRSSDRSARDCDGPLYQSWEDVMDLLECSSHWSGDPDVLYPRWDRVKKSFRQRDVYAEMMNY